MCFWTHKNPSLAFGLRCVVCVCVCVCCVCVCVCAVPPRVLCEVVRQWLMEGSNWSCLKRIVFAGPPALMQVLEACFPLRPSPNLEVGEPHPPGAEESEPRPPNTEESEPHPPGAEESEPHPPGAEESEPRPPGAEESEPRPPNAEESEPRPPEVGEGNSCSAEASTEICPSTSEPHPFTPEPRLSTPEPRPSTPEPRLSTPELCLSTPEPRPSTPGLHAESSSAKDPGKSCDNDKPHPPPSGDSKVARRPSPLSPPTPGGVVSPVSGESSPSVRRLIVVFETGSATATAEESTV